MKIAAKYQKPGTLIDLIIGITNFPPTVQFHTGIGDNDLLLSKSSASLLQPLIRAFPDTPIVLLHGSYPFTREAGYLAAVYRNVYLDFGELFPYLSRMGQKRLVEHMLELCPTTKVLWSSESEPVP